MLQAISIPKKSFPSAVFMHTLDSHLMHQSLRTTLSLLVWAVDMIWKTIKLTQNKRTVLLMEVISSSLQMKQFIHLHPGLKPNTRTCVHSLVPSLDGAGEKWLQRSGLVQGSGAGSGVFLYQIQSVPKCCFLLSPNSLRGILAIFMLNSSTT